MFLIYTTTLLMKKSQERNLLKKNEIPNAVVSVLGIQDSQGRGMAVASKSAHFSVSENTLVWNSYLNSIVA